MCDMTHSYRLASIICMNKNKKSHDSMQVLAFNIDISNLIVTKKQES